MPERMFDGPGNPSGFLAILDTERQR